MQAHEQFDLDRHVSIENSVDPLGRKWEIKGERGSSLVHARPNPDRADATIPKDFAGQWTSPTVLREKILHWLNKQWDSSDKTVVKAERAAHAAKQTPEESLNSLPDEVKAELGDIIAIVKPVLQEKEHSVDLATMEWKQLKKLAVEAGVTARSRKDIIKALAEVSPSK